MTVEVVASIVVVVVVVETTMDAWLGCGGHGGEAIVEGVLAEVEGHAFMIVNICATLTVDVFSEFPFLSLTHIHILAFFKDDCHELTNYAFQSPTLILCRVGDDFGF